MRMVPTETLKIKDPRGTMTRSKRKSTSHVAHCSVPLKGLSRLAQLNEADPLLASVLTNFIVEQDRITLRPGYGQIGSIADGRAISTMIPYYGVDEKFVVAAGDGLFNATGTRVGTHVYGGDQWQWTSFADLSQKKQTIMVNGHDGVFSWDGTSGSLPSMRATETDLPEADPVDTFSMPEADPAGFTQLEAFVAQPRDDFASRAASFSSDPAVQAAPPSYDPNKLDKILAHMNRIWLADSQDLIVYYWPLQTVGGALGMLPLNAYFKRGGYIKSINTWTYSGGTGMDNLLVIFSSNGEAAIYSGVDPATDFKLIGVFRFDSPMSPASVINYGGELYVLISTGLVPMSTLLKAEVENLGTSDQNVIQEFSDVSKTFRNAYGWSVIINSQTNHAVCNMPMGSGKYQQLVRFMPNAIWSKWTDLPARCWGWLGNHTYFCSEDGKIYRGGKEYLDDNGLPINVDVRLAWSSFKSMNKKQFKLVRTYMISDSVPSPFVDLDVDYENLPPTNKPDIAVGGVAAVWNVASWNTSSWAMDEVPRQYWQGVVGLGRVGAPRIRASLQGTTFSLTGVDVIYEDGGLM